MRKIIYLVLMFILSGCIPDMGKPNPVIPPSKSFLIMNKTQYDVEYKISFTNIDEEKLKLMNNEKQDIYLDDINTRVIVAGAYDRFSIGYHDNAVYKKGLPFGDDFRLSITFANKNSTIIYTSHDLLTNSTYEDGTIVSKCSISDTGSYLSIHVIGLPQKAEF